ncbi:MAG: hypothetical protein ACN4GM_01980 [Gammaproteobacteria bacterium]
MKIERKNICKNLPKKGFVEDDSGHHLYFHFYYDGVLTGAYTYISHSAKHKDYSNAILTKMRQQLKLNSNRDVVELVNCPMDEEEYIAILKQKGFIE